LIFFLVSGSLGIPLELEYSKISVTFILFLPKSAVFSIIIWYLENNRDAWILSDFS
jgi:hypothetical protein